MPKSKRSGGVQRRIVTGSPVLTTIARRIGNVTAAATPSDVHARARATHSRQRCRRRGVTSI
jgi:hypothetical protein